VDNYSTTQEIGWLADGEVADWAQCCQKFPKLLLVLQLIDDQAVGFVRWVDVGVLEGSDGPQWLAFVYFVLVSKWMTVWYRYNLGTCNNIWRCAEWYFGCTNFSFPKFLGYVHPGRKIFVCLFLVGAKSALLMVCGDRFYNQSSCWEEGLIIDHLYHVPAGIQFQLNRLHTLQMPNSSVVSLSQTKKLT
jgi:hypothetical protein